MLSLDNKVFQNLSKGIFVGYSAEAARLILSSICTALMTVIGVLFSITIVVIQQVSAQYSPRVVEIFIKSRNSQFVLGLYVGTFIYGILLLRQIPSLETGDGFQIPQSAISLAILFSLICISFLVQYVHYITHAIKSTNIIKSIIAEGLEYLAEYEDFKNSYAQTIEYENLPETVKLKAPTYGYFQSYLPEKIDRILGTESRAKVRLVVHIGEYINSGTVVAEIQSREKLPEKIIKSLDGTFSIGAERTHTQDVRYSIRQLVDITLRALSPGINDPTTAMEALNGIGVLLTEWMKQTKHSGLFSLKMGNQLIIPQFTLDDLLEQSFAQTIVSAKGHYQVLEKILHVLHSATPYVHSSGETITLDSYIKNVEKLSKEDRPVFVSRYTESSTGGFHEKNSVNAHQSWSADLPPKLISRNRTSQKSQKEDGTGTRSL